jgi:hypothetical protein
MKRTEIVMVRFSNVKKLVLMCSILLLMSNGLVIAQDASFKANPGKRQIMVQSLRDSSSRKKTEALAWAKKNNFKTHSDNGKRVMELIEIRDGRPIYYSTDNENAAISTAANQVRTTSPYNVNGAGVTVGIWDGGSVRSSHQELSGRITLKDSSSAISDHSTHVAGTIGASGVQSLAKGMAPSIHIDSYDFSDDEAEMTSVAAATVGESSKLYLSNHSYGASTGWIYGDLLGLGANKWYWLATNGSITSQDADPLFGQYSSGAKQWDDIVYNAPYYLPFKSSGNDRNDDLSSGQQFIYNTGTWSSQNWVYGYYNSSIHPGGDGSYKNGFDNISTSGNAKNIITVGAVNDAVSGGNRLLANAGMTTFSSWGPADDGRIKPDVVANGYNLYSCIGTGDSTYDSMSGTSMSSPNACGSAALLVDLFDNYFPGLAMRASTLKGLIIHTADDLGRAGPDYEYGWGLMNTKDAADLLTDLKNGNSHRLTEQKLDSTKLSHTVSLTSDGSSSVHITVCWTDPSGTAMTVLDSRSPILVNDLDLKITGPGGTYYPYKLSYSSPSSLATTGENNIDNVEQVYIASPSAGTYTVTVDYDGSLQNNEQWFSMLISGLEASSLDSITIAGSSLLNEGETTPYICTANYSDGSSADVTSSTTWTENSSYASISSSGLFAAAAVSSVQNVTITASYTEGGVTKGDTHSVTIENISFPYQDWLSDLNVPVGEQGYADDPSGDGIQNLLKYAIGLSPIESCSSTDVFEQLIEEANTCSIVYKKAKGTEGVELFPLWSDYLLPSNWNSNGFEFSIISQTDSNATWKATHSVTGECGYIRIKAQIDE